MIKIISQNNLFRIFPVKKNNEYAIIKIKIQVSHFGIGKNIYDDNAQAVRMLHIIYPQGFLSINAGVNILLTNHVKRKPW